MPDLQSLQTQTQNQNPSWPAYGMQSNFPPMFPSLANQASFQNQNSAPNPAVPSPTIINPYAGFGLGGQSMFVNPQAQAEMKRLI